MHLIRKQNATSDKQIRPPSITYIRGLRTLSPPKASPGIRASKGIWRAGTRPALPAAHLQARETRCWVLGLGTRTEKENKGSRSTNSKTVERTRLCLKPTGRGELPVLTLCVRCNNGIVHCMGFRDFK